MPARTFSPVAARQIAAPAIRPPAPAPQQTRTAGAPVGLPRFATPVRSIAAGATSTSRDVAPAPTPESLASPVVKAPPAGIRRKTAADHGSGVRSRLGQPNNLWENEAQLFAVRVRESTQTSARTKDAPGPGSRSSPAHPGIGPSPPAVDGSEIHVLPSTARVPLETFTGADLGAVRIHTGFVSEVIASAVGARAFTRFGQIHLGSGANTSDASLLAYETAHVLQQTWPADRLRPLGLSPAPAEMLLRQPSIIPQIARRREAQVKLLTDWFLPTPSSLDRTLRWLGNDTLFQRVSIAVVAAIRPTLYPMRALQPMWAAVHKEVEKDALRRRVWDVMLARVSRTDDPALIDAARGLATAVPDLFGARWGTIQEALKASAAVGEYGRKKWSGLSTLDPGMYGMLNTLGPDITTMLDNLTDEPWVAELVRTALGCPASIRTSAEIGGWVNAQYEMAENYVKELGRAAANVQSSQFDTSMFTTLAGRSATATTLGTDLRQMAEVMEKREGFILQRAKIAALLPGIRQKIADLDKSMITPASSMPYAFGGLGTVMNTWGNASVLTTWFGSDFDWMGSHAGEFETWVSQVAPPFFDVADRTLAGLDHWVSLVAETISEADTMDDVAPTTPRWWNVAAQIVWALQGTRERFINWMKERIPLLKELITQAAELWRAAASHFEHFVGRVFKEGRIIAPLWEFFLNVVGLRTPKVFVEDVANRGASLLGKILKHPIKFLTNLGAAIKLGLKNFGHNIGNHLVTGILDWLFDQFDLPSPPSFAGIVKALAAKIGLELAYACERIAVYLRGRGYDTTGPKVEKRLREAIKVGATTFRWIGYLITGEFGKLWEELKDHLSRLWQWIIDKAVRYVMETLKEKLIDWVISMAEPTGLMAAFEFIKAVYVAVQTLMKYAKKLLEMVREVFRAIREIAEGKIDRAAAWVESGAAKILAVVMAFGARYLKLDSVVKALNEGLGWVKEKIVTPAIDAIVRLAGSTWDWIFRKARQAAEWWKNRGKFTDPEGNTRTLEYKNQNNAAVLWVSEPEGGVRAAAGPRRETLEEFLKNFVPTTKRETEIKNEIMGFTGQIDKVKEDTGGGFGQANGDLIHTLFHEIVILLGQLGGKGAKPPPTKVDPTTKLIFSEAHGKRMEASPLSTNPGDNIGSAPTSTETVLWSKVKGYLRGNDTHYIKGHLLNHHLHGPGIWKNMTPIARTTNTKMETEAEHHVKKAVLSENKVVHYEVNMVYGNHRKTPKTVAEEELPSHIEIKAEQLIYKKGTWDLSGVMIVKPIKLENEIR